MPLDFPVVKGFRSFSFWLGFAVFLLAVVWDHRRQEIEITTLRKQLAASEEKQGDIFNSAVDNALSSEKWKRAYEVNKAAALQFSDDAVNLEKDRDKWKSAAYDLSDRLFALRQDYNALVASSSETAGAVNALRDQNIVLQNEESVLRDSADRLQRENTTLSLESAPTIIEESPSILQPVPITGATIMGPDGGISTIDFH